VSRRRTRATSDAEGLIMFRDWVCYFRRIIKEPPDRVPPVDRLRAVLPVGTNRAP